MPLSRSVSRRGRDAVLSSVPTTSTAIGDWIDVCERLTEFDELVVSWRLRHIQIVERTIGVRMGTGGSAGSSYLKHTLDKKFFPELWEARTMLQA